MKCPTGTVEIAVWSDGIFFDEKYKVEDEDPILGIQNHANAPEEDKLLYKEITDALKPVMDLMGPSWIAHNNNVYLFTPEEFETLTEGIEYHAQGNPQDCQAG